MDMAIYIYIYIYQVQVYKLAYMYYLNGTS